MNSDDLNVRKSLASSYLEHMDALAVELRAGMDAIGANALPTFEQSVARQQQICMSLCRLHQQMSVDQGMQGEGSGLDREIYTIDRSLEKRIEQAGKLLQEISAQYAALLSHAGESVHLFAGLCRSYAGHFEAPVLASTARTTWSSES